MGRYRRTVIETFDEIVTLVGKTESNQDEWGNPIIAESKRDVFCNESGVFRNEFYQAGTTGLKPSYTLTIHEFEYDNEEKVIYKGKTYEVLRIYPEGGLLELTVGEKIGSNTTA